jgi:hypothetical protein
VDNTLTFDDLEGLKDLGETDNLIEKLLSTFGKVQIAQVIEFWCVQEEKWITNDLAGVMNFKKEILMANRLRDITLPRMKGYINTVLSHTMWPVSDLRPLQSIVWAIESTSAPEAPLRQLLHCSYSTLLVISQRHCWCNSFNDLHSIGNELISPPFWNTDIVRSQQGIDDDFG